MLALSIALLSMTGSINAPAGIRLLDDAPLLAQLDAPLTPFELPRSDAQVSAQQLEVDLQALKKLRPGLGAPITLVAVGGGAGLLGVLYLALSGLAGIGGAFNPILILGIVGLGLGIPLVVIGAWMLFNRLEDRARIDAQTVELKRQLQDLRRPPVLLPVPFSASVSGPETSMQLALF